MTKKQAVLFLKVLTGCVLISMFATLAGCERQCGQTDTVGTTGTNAGTVNSYGAGPVKLFADIEFETMPEGIAVGRKVQFAFRIIPVPNHRSVYHPAFADLATNGRTIDTLPLVLDICIVSDDSGINKPRGSDTDVFLSIAKQDDNQRLIIDTQVSQLTRDNVLYLLTTMDEISKGKTFRIDALFRREADYRIFISARYMFIEPFTDYWYGERDILIEETFYKFGIQARNR